MREAASYPVLKIKLGSEHDEEILRVVREAAPTAIVRVDANAAWTPKQRAAHDRRADGATAWSSSSSRCRRTISTGLRFVRERSPLPIIADETCLVATDIPRLAGAVDGINIKLAKCGGIARGAADDRGGARARHARDVPAA